MQTVNSFNLLLCDNLPQPGDALATANVTNITELIYALFMGQAGALASPFFYEDTTDPNANQELTFFVQPTLAETSFTRWIGWVIAPYNPNLGIIDPKYWQIISLAPQIPVRQPPSPPDPEAVFQYQPNVDWIASEGTLVSYGTSVIGREGGTKAPGTFAGGAIFRNKAGLAILSNSPFSFSSSTAPLSGPRVISSSGLDYASVLSFALKAQTRINAVPSALQ